MSDRQNETEKIGEDEPLVGAANAPNDRDYKVGRGRPPKAFRWKKGQSGNPRGRPRKKPDKRAILERLMNERVVIREDGRPLKVTKEEALFRCHLAKAIKGDTRSAKFVMEEAAHVGLGADHDSSRSALLPPKDQSLQSDMLFANLNLELLSDGDKIELARLGQIVDLGGDFTALNLRDFGRAKQIAEKGRGRDITPNA